MFRADRGRKHLNDKERGAIIAYSNDGKSVRFISDRLGIGVGTVSLWQTRYRDMGDVTRQVGSGRPKKLPRKKKTIYPLRWLPSQSRQRKRLQENSNLNQANKIYRNYI
jgi:transposase